MFEYDLDLARDVLDSTLNIIEPKLKCMYSSCEGPASRLYDAEMYSLTA